MKTPFDKDPSPPSSNDASPEEVEMDKYVKDYRTSYKDSLIKAAKQRRERAVSYHGFRVGCAVLSKNKDSSVSKEPYLIHTGHNYKPKQQEQFGKDKRCGERRAIEEALKVQGLIVAIVVVSQETVTGNAAVDVSRSGKVLHPCRECRHMFRALRAKNILRGESIICMVNEKSNTQEEMTMDEFLGLYPEHSPPTIPEEY